jgi:hypothetical protein
VGSRPDGREEYVVAARDVVGEWGGIDETSNGEELSSGDWL